MKLFFIPGSGCGKEAWVCQTEYFTDSEAIALPGHPEGEPCSSVDEYMEWLRAYIHQQRYQDVVLVGHSLGGAIAQLYGLKYGDELKALVLIATGARLRVANLLAAAEMIGDEDAWRKFLEDRYSLVDPEISRGVVEARMQISPAVLANDLHCCDEFDIMEEVHTIKLPTLVICGTQDELTPVKYSNYLASKIEGAKQVVVDGTTHWGHMEKPKEVNQAIEEFLGRLK